MKQKPSIIAQKLLNLYRQEHVIVGGWATVNPVFIAEADADVTKELRDLPNGKKLIRHIENLRSGKTPMDSIEHDLLPYGGTMENYDTDTSLTPTEISELLRAVNNFTTDKQGLDTISALPVVRKFGAQWPIAIKHAIGANPAMQEKWATVVQTWHAYRLWDSANNVITTPISDRTRAQIQADMPEYETYLPMFGTPGADLLEKLRNFISSIPQENQSDLDAASVIPVQ